MVVTQRDRLREKPPDLGNASRALAMRGVPREVSLPGWTGPTFFVSEVVDGRLRTIEAFAPTIAEAFAISGWVLGSVREPMSFSAEDAAALFVVERATGHVVLVDLEGGERAVLVSSTAALFLDAVDVFVQWWHSVRPRDPELRRIRADLLRLDAAAMASPQHFWPRWLEDLEGL